MKKFPIFAVIEKVAMSKDVDSAKGKILSQGIERND